VTACLPQILAKEPFASLAILNYKKKRFAYVLLSDQSDRDKKKIFDNEGLLFIMKLIKKITMDLP